MEHPGIPPKLGITKAQILWAVAIPSMIHGHRHGIAIEVTSRQEQCVMMRGVCIIGVLLIPSSLAFVRHLPGVTAASQTA
jgi:hypothetical protein